MFIGLDHIRELFHEQESCCHIGNTDYCMTAFETLDDAVRPYSVHVLYIANNLEALKQIIPIAYMNLLILNSASEDLSAYVEHFPAPVNYLEIQADDISSVRLALRDYFNMWCATGLMSESLLDILFYENGIQTMVDQFTRGFNNPLLVFDAGYHLIAANWEMLEKTPDGKRIIENMGFTDNEFRMVNRHGIHDRVKHSEVPIRAYNADIGCDQLLCEIDTRKEMGHIVLNAVYRPFNDVDIRLLTMLKEAICQQLKKEEFVRNSEGFPYEYFLKDMLDSKIATSAQFMNRFSYINAEFSDSMHCLVVETARTSNIISVYALRSRIEGLFANTRSIIYNGEVIAILCLKDGRQLTEKDLEKIQKFCIEQNIYAGLSNNFHSLVQFPEYYRQALRSLELGIEKSHGPCAFIYKDYYMNHLLNIFLQKEVSTTYCHPKLLMLIEYDKTHDSRFAESLYTYLIHERNLSEAANAMFIHRNTLLYRLKRIEALVRIDYDSIQERQYIIVSYQMCQAKPDQ